MFEYWTYCATRLLGCDVPAGGPRITLSETKHKTLPIHIYETREACLKEMHRLADVYDQELKRQLQETARWRARQDVQLEGGDPQPPAEASTDDTDRLGWRRLTACRHTGHTYNFYARQRGASTCCSVAADNPWQAVLNFAETHRWVIDPGTMMIEVSGGNLPPNVITLWWLRRRMEPTWETKEAEADALSPPGDQDGNRT